MFVTAICSQLITVITVYCKGKQNMQILCVAAGRVLDGKACGTDRHSIRCSLTNLLWPGNTTACSGMEVKPTMD